MIKHKLSIGTIQFGLKYGVSNQVGKPSLKQVKKIIDIAKKHHLETYDTAPIYGNSETILGSVLPKPCKVITKIPPLTEPVIGKKQVDKIRKIFFNSLANLKREHVYALLVHNSNDLLKPGSDHLYSEMKKLKQSAKISRIGISIYSSKQLDAVLNNYDIDLVQLPLNIFDQRLIESGHLDQLKKKGIEVHVRSVFLQGLLLMNQCIRPDYFLKFANNLDKYFERIKNQGLSPLEAALGFVSALPQVDKVIIGVNNAKELQEIIMASNTAIDPIQYKDVGVTDINLIDPSMWNI